MTRHFERSFRFSPHYYKKAEDKVWNAFVAFTHKIGLRSFRFTPDYYSEYTADDFKDNAWAINNPAAEKSGDK